MSKILKNNFVRGVSFISNIYCIFDKQIETLNNTKKKIIFAWTIAVSLCFFIIFFLNILTPMIADDFGYLLIFDGVFQTKVTSISDVFLSQKEHYFLWGGRSVVHFIAQSLLLLPPIIIDTLNTIVYMIYVLLIYFLIKGRKSNNIGLFILINLAVWFLQPAFGDTILWITGSANYLWGMVLVLLFILPYRFYEGNINNKLVIILKTSLLFFYGIIAGWTNENTAAGMIVIAILFLLYFRSNDWKIPFWGISGILGSIIGYLIMILAPGNLNRAGEAVTSDWLVFAYRLFHHTQDFIVNCGCLNLLGFIIIILFWHYTKRNKGNILSLFFIFFIGVLVGVYSMVLSPSFPPRAWFGVITYNIIAIGILLYNLNYNNKFLKQIYYAIILAGMIAFPFSFYSAYKDVYSIHSVFKQRSILVSEAKDKGLPYCEVERYSAKTKFVHSEDVEAYKFMYAYYDIDIRFK